MLFEERSRSAGCMNKKFYLNPALRLRDLDLHSVSPLRTNIGELCVSPVNH